MLLRCFTLNTVCECFVTTDKSLYCNCCFSYRSPLYHCSLNSCSLTMYIMLTRTLRKKCFLNCDTRQRIRQNET